MRVKYYKYIISIFVCLCFCLQASAEEIQGYVKTRGRMVNGVLKPGKMLPGVLISVEGSSTVITDSNGAFTLHISSGKTTKIRSISKSGYVLVDKDILSRQISIGKTLILVMDREDILQEDRNAAIRKIRRTLNTKFDKYEDEIDTQKAQNKLTEEEYQKRLQELFDNLSKSEQLVKEMAERYASIDYDLLDGFNRQVLMYIEEGRLQKADSIINSSENVQARVSELHRQDSINNHHRHKLEEQERLNAKQMKEFGEDLLRESQIYLLKNEVYNAMYCLAMRTDLDSMSVQWAIDAGDFALKYKYNYAKSLEYYQRALRHALNQSSNGQSEEIADCYCRIASIFVNEANYLQAYNYYRDALNLRQYLYGTSDPRTAEVIEQLGMIYNSMGQYNIAHEHIEKALNIFVDEYKDVYGEQHANIASCYDNMGVVLDNLGEYEKAKEYTDKALHLFINLYSPNDIKVAACYSNLGGILENLDDSKNAIENYSKSIEIYLENHREYEAAVVHNNVGTLYYNMGKFNKAHDSFEQAIQLIQKHEAEDHPVYRKILENMEEVTLKLQHVRD